MNANLPPPPFYVTRQYSEDSASGVTPSSVSSHVEELFLRVHLLGNFQVTRKGLLINGWRSDKVRALFAYLVIESNRAHAREDLATLLWGDYDDSSARANLRQTLTNLRQMFSSEDEDPLPLRLHIDRRSVQIDVADDIWVDVLAFDALITAADIHDRRSDAVALLSQALDLYRDDFLKSLSIIDSDPFEDWRRAKQEELHQQATLAMQNITDIFLAQQDPSRAQHYARRQLALEPWKESAHRQLMIALALSGQRAAALMQFAICRKALAEHVGVEPTAETLDIHEQIKQNSLKIDTIPAISSAGSSASRPLPPCPYRGLEAYTSNDARFFFGREAFVRDLKQSVQAYPIVAVVGASGVGKSSAISAGLLPLLAKDSQVEQVSTQSRSMKWRVASMRPSRQPFEALASALLALQSPRLSTTEQLFEARKLGAALREGHVSLPAVISHLMSPNDVGVGGQEGGNGSGWQGISRYGDEQRLLLVINQFERLFALCKDKSTRRAFIDTLVQVADAANASNEVGYVCGILIELRADFMGSLLSHRRLADALRRSMVHLAPMTSAELHLAVSAPAAELGIQFEPGLVRRIIIDAGDEGGSLPLLEFALTALWHHQAFGDTLTHRAYQDIGRVQGALVGHAEYIYGRLDQAGKALAKQVILRMIHSNHGTGEPASRVELGEKAWKMVQQLAYARLVVIGRDTGNPDSAELAHEALITNWARVQQWLRSDQDFQNWYNRLSATIRQWEELSRDDGGLLRGATLDEAQSWIVNRDEDISIKAKAFVAASAQHESRTELERAEQQRREIEQAQELAVLEKRTSRRLRLLLVGMAVITVLLAASAVLSNTLWRRAQRQTEAVVIARSLAESERNRAEDQARLALSRQLGAQAINNMDNDIDLALLLLAESLNRSNRDQDKASLLAAFDLDPLLYMMGHVTEAELLRMTFVGDEDRVIVATGAHELLDWDIGNNEYSRLPFDAGAGTQDMVISQDGAIIAVHGPTLTFADAASGELLSDTGKALGSADHLVDFADGGRLFLLSEDEGIATLWDVQSGQLAQTIQRESGTTTRAISPDGNKIVIQQTVEGNVWIQLWDIVLDQPLGELHEAHAADIHMVRFNGDGSLFATAGFDGAVRLWDGETGAPLYEPLLAHDGRVLAVAFSRDGRVLASGGTDGKIALWDVNMGKPIGSKLSGHSDWVRELAFSADDSKLASADAGGHVLLWDYRKRTTLFGHNDRVREVAISPDGRTLVSSSFDRTLSFWNADNGALLQQVETPHEGSIIKLIYSPDGLSFATGDTRGAVAIWNASTRELRYDLLNLNEAVIIGMAYSRDGSKIAAGDLSGHIRLWDVASGETLAGPLPAHDSWAMSLAFSPDGQILVSGSSGGEIGVWDANTLGPVIEPFDAHASRVTSLVFSSDGGTLVSTSSDRSIQLWDTVEYKHDGPPLEGHRAQVWISLFDPSDPTRLVTMDSDGSVIWWDVATRTPLRPPLRTGQESESMAISPDGESLYLGSFDASASIWRVDHDSWQEATCRIANRSLSAGEWHSFFGDVPYRATCGKLPR